VAEKEGLSRITIRELIERMKKRYEDTEEGLE
jgi:DNA-binding PadR family transcriptional regulator